MNEQSSRDRQVERLRCSLEGLSLGDAFGEMFFGAPRSAREAIKRDELPTGTWWFTDDTAMALAIADVLEACGTIDQDRLAERFCERYLEDPGRGYGKGTRAFCEWLQRGVTWQQASALTFKGGSKGNGSAMRVAPVGAFFAESDYSVIVEEARKSAEVTHQHPEGVAGAIAVALAAAVAWKERNSPVEIAAKRIFENLLAHVPKGDTLQGIEVASHFDSAADPEHAAKRLGNGFLVTCPDTVPYVIWSACRRLDNFTEAILETLAGGGDTDTTCAMVGGIVALRVGRIGLPDDWLTRREKLNFTLNP